MWMISLLAQADAAAAPVQQAAQAAHASGDPAAIFVGNIIVFVLAVFIGFELIAKVPPTLHTPLMSGSNAISGITIVGALVCAGRLGASHPTFAAVLGFLAVITAMINVVGGFDVTDRMLAMFKKK